MRIKKIIAREILDSRGLLTLEVEIKTDSALAIASVPSGTSVGKYEAISISTAKATAIVKKIAKNFLAKELEPEEIDEALMRLDGTKNKSKLGANTTLAISVAAHKAAALENDLELWQYLNKKLKIKPKTPLSLFNFINGGAHGGNELDFQEYLLVPRVRAQKLKHYAIESFQKLKSYLEKNLGKQATNYGLEGGFTPNFTCLHEPLDAICEALNYAFKNFYLGLDCATSRLFKNGAYFLEKRNWSAGELIERYLKLATDYPLIYLEDPFPEDAFEDWAYLNKKLKRILIVGDDLTATNPERIELVAKKKCCNAVILKPNQIGTLSEALRASKIASKYGLKKIVSHRSGESDDAWIVDFAIGIGADGLKAGAPARERIIKWNRLFRILEKL